MKEVIKMKKFYEKYRKKWWFWFIAVSIIVTIVDCIGLLFYDPQVVPNQSSTSKYSVKNGLVVDYQTYHTSERGQFYGLDGTDVFEIVVIVTERATVEDTLDQNYENAYELIKNYDLTAYHTFKYTAIAVDEKGEEYTMMSFNIYAPWIKKIKETWTANGTTTVKAYATDRYIDESLKQKLQ